MINEVGRMYGPGNALFVREVAKPHQIKGIQLDKGHLINASFVPNNYNPVYYDNPFEFNPERWLNEQQAVTHPPMFIPFSSGPRNCIGQHLAVMETKLIMAKMMHRYDWSIDKPEDVHLTIGFLANPSEFTTTLRRKHPSKRIESVEN